MSREIEIKLPLSEESFIKLFRQFSKLEPEFLFKSDEYYSKFKTKEERIKNNEPQVIRIRTEKSVDSNKFNTVLSRKFINMSTNSDNIDEYLAFLEEVKSFPAFSQNSYFTLKTKTIENGMEFNEEKETFIQDCEVLQSFLAHTEHFKWFEKNKTAISVNLTEKKSGILFHAELELVNKLPYIEIECTSDEKPADIIKQSLEDLVLELDLDPKTRDSRSWKEIIQAE